MMMNQQKAIKLEIDSLHKQGYLVKTKNWLDLPSEVTANILSRVGVVDILESAWKVCTAWREICKDPTIWWVIYMDVSSYPKANLPLDEMCMHVVDRSQGQLVDITIVKFGCDDMLEYIANRSSKLKRLTIACCEDSMYKTPMESLKKFPLLEELSLYELEISKEGIETAGHYCPMLRILKVNLESWRAWFEGCDEEIAMAIGQNLHELRHLELIGNRMSNEGLEMILDGCHHLESLDLRECFFIDLEGDLGKRCSQQIKCLKLFNDSLKGVRYMYKNRWHDM